MCGRPQARRPRHTEHTAPRDQHPTTASFGRLNASSPAGSKATLPANTAMTQGRAELATSRSGHRSVLVREDERRTTGRALRARNRQVGAQPPEPKKSTFSYTNLGASSAARRVEHAPARVWFAAAPEGRRRTGVARAEGQLFGRDRGQVDSRRWKTRSSRLAEPMLTITRPAVTDSRKLGVAVAVRTLAAPADRDGRLLIATGTSTGRRARAPSAGHRIEARTEVEMRLVVVSFRPWHEPTWVTISVSVRCARARTPSASCGDDVVGGRRASAARGSARRCTVELGPTARSARPHAAGRAGLVLDHGCGPLVEFSASPLDSGHVVDDRRWNRTGELGDEVGGPRVRRWRWCPGRAVRCSLAEAIAPGDRR